MGHEAQDAEALRRRLYRPDASTADLAVYLRATAEEEPAGTAQEPAAVAPPVRASLRPFVVGGSVVAAAALLGAVLLTSAPRTPAPTSAPSLAAATPEQSEDSDGSWHVTFVQVDVLDGGRADHADGAARADGPDRYRYVVAPGDTVDAMADRFGLCTADVLDALPYGVDPGALPSGASLELSHSEKNTC
jgi:hypothetical protein